MPSNSNYQRSMPALHEIADINQLARGDQNVISQYKTFLIAYLEDIRGTKDSHGLKQVFQTTFFHVTACSSG